MAEGFPVARAGRKIGLLGGSFDPAHEGHAHITREALKRFRLDEVWWLVSPGNPLKTRGPAPIEKRLTQAQRVMRHPRVRITALEQQLGTRFTAETLEALTRRYPGVSFVWLMGADNLASIGRVASITGQARSTLTRENGQPTDSNLAQPSSVILLRARTPICASVF